jgi:hypothetical protein
MGVQFKALPWQPVGSDTRIWTFRADGYLCTHCVVALHQESETVLEIHKEHGITPEIHRDNGSNLSGIAGGIRWSMAAEDVRGTETKGNACMMCGDDCTVHSVPDVETHGHFTRLTIHTTPALPFALLGKS